jgi:hypothetical protein
MSRTEAALIAKGIPRAFAAKGFPREESREGIPRGSAAYRSPSRIRSVANDAAGFVALALYTNRTRCMTSSTCDHTAFKWPIGAPGASSGSSHG